MRALRNRIEYWLAPLVLLDLSLREKVVGVALVIPMFWIGLYPATFLRPMDRSVTELLRTMEARGPGLALAPDGLRLAEAEDEGEPQPVLEAETGE